MTLFKQTWKKVDAQQLSVDMIEKMVMLAFPAQKLDSYEFILGGCSNINIKIYVSKKPDPFILRVYLRDKKAAYREQKLGVRLMQVIPLPVTYYIGAFENYTFAVTKFLSGITLRDYLIQGGSDEIMYDVGVLLAKIGERTFLKPGSFDENLNITPQENIVGFLQSLPCDIVSKINPYLDKYAHLFPSEHERSLVHGDFDPSNILVDKIDGQWKITGILDWEFSFSGSVFWDIANMLRYAHQMPQSFEENFLKGLGSCDIEFSGNWRMTVHMLNLVSLLDCLARGHPCEDIIDDILKRLENMPAKIEVISYDPNWIRVFEEEASLMKSHCLEVHHIGSTSVPGLIAKPVIDIVAVVKNAQDSISFFESIGYVYRGEVNIPFHFYFKKGDEVHLHVYEQENPEIELNILFRDYLRNSVDARNEYARLKQELLTKESSFIKNQTRFSGYTLGKNDFICKVLDSAGFKGIRLMHCMHTKEWDGYNRIRVEQSFDAIAAAEQGHYHFVLYQGIKIVCAAHIEFMARDEVVLHELATDEFCKMQGFGKHMMILLEKWIRSQDKKTIKMHAYLSAEHFYRKLGYVDMLFDYPFSPGDGIDLGKVL